MHRLLIIASLTLTFIQAGSAAELSPTVVSWLAHETNIHSWSADFIQTRTLKSLTQPLKATGHLWFAAPNRFHWELGKPAQTIAIRSANELLILYPRLKRVERFSLAGMQTGPWRDALALLDAGFPRSQQELESQYNVISQEVTGQTCHLVLQPKSASARKMMPQISIDFDPNNLVLHGTELQFADGSSLRNDFQDPVLNTPVDEKLFNPEIPADYKIIEPLKKP